MFAFARFKVLFLVSAAALSASPARADFMYTISGNASGGDGPLSATALFSVSAGQISVTLTNTLSLSAFNDVGQTISDIGFTLSNAAGNLSSSTATGQQGNVDSNGHLTYISGTPGRFLGVGGGVLSINGNTVLLEAIGGGQPDQLITPYLADGGNFSTNPGITAHDPYTIGPATFILNLSGITAATTVTGVTFSFGTSPDTYLDGTPGRQSDTSTTPAPPTLVMAAIGLGPLGMVGWLRRRRV